MIGKKNKKKDWDLNEDISKGFVSFEEEVDLAISDGNNKEDWDLFEDILVDEDSSGEIF